jgi:hypothetical protein
VNLLFRARKVIADVAKSQEICSFLEQTLFGFMQFFLLDFTGFLYYHENVTSKNFFLILG